MKLLISLQHLCSNTCANLWPVLFWLKFLAMKTWVSKSFWINVMFSIWLCLVKGLWPDYDGKMVTSCNNNWFAKCWLESRPGGICMLKTWWKFRKSE